MLKQFDRFFVAYNQLDALRADGRGNGVLPEILKFIPVLLITFIGQLAMSDVIGVVYTQIDKLYYWNTDKFLLTPGTGSTQVFLIAVSLFSTLGMIGVTLLCLRFAFKRPLSVTGFAGPFAKEYGLGLLAGLAVFALGVGFAAVTGTLTVTGLSDSFALGPWLLIFVGFLFQGMSEELLCRGCFMLNVARKNSVLAGILCNSLCFMALHLLNNGIAPLALVNLFLYGVFASLYFLWRGNIWGIAAFHSMWNFAQGNVFGILVSGGDFGVSLLVSVSDPSGALINGGDFGLEGGLAVTVVLTLGIAFVLWRNLRRLAGTPMPLEGTE